MHRRYFKAQDIDRVTWRDYALSVAFAMALLLACVVSI
jgi:hypothetical protein